jgi:acrylyl-CoA reductase (NADPH)
MHQTECGRREVNMTTVNFRALVVQETGAQTFTRAILQRTVTDLPQNEVLVRVRYSSLNFKDALSATGNRGVTRRYPHTPGIDAAGEVVESASERFKAGDAVIVTGFDLGMNTAGGFGQYIRVPENWIVPCPDGLALKESMVYGTAGFTAALSVYRLEKAGILPGQGQILVTGATGGVGTIATGILAKAGYAVVAVTGKSDQKKFLMDMGAQEVISRDQADDAPGKPMLKTRWAGAVDTVGGGLLEAAIRATTYGGAVACCGNVASGDLRLTVYPFILRGVSLLGVDSTHCTMDVRTKLWRRIAGPWKLDPLERIFSEISLEGLEEKIQQILQGKVRGRTVVDLDA